MFYTVTVGKHNFGGNDEGRTSIDSTGSLLVDKEGRRNSHKDSKRFSTRYSNAASGSDMTDDSLSVVSAPPGPLATK